MAGPDLVIRVAFDARWRVGTGTARSNAVDSETWLDGSGHVTVPASHLKRRLRAEAERLAALRGWTGLCAGRLAAARSDPDVGEPVAMANLCGPDHERPCVTCRLFGAPRVEPGWRFGSARLQHDRLDADPLTAAVAAAAERRVASHNRVDPWTRRVGEDLLFSLETARAGAELTAVVTRLDPAENDPAAEREIALLVGAVGLLDTLGGRRRRGYGRCRAWVDGAPLGRVHDDWVRTLLALPREER